MGIFVSRAKHSRFHSRLRSKRLQGNESRRVKPAGKAPPTSVNTGSAHDSVSGQNPDHSNLRGGHTAVLAYVAARRERTELAKTIAPIRARWSSNEAPAFSPCDDEKVKAECPAGQFLLAENKRTLAYTDPHGRSIRWLAKRDGSEGLTRNRRKSTHIPLRIDGPHKTGFHHRGGPQTHGNAKPL